MDRIVSQSAHLVLHGIFDSEFTTSNFGFSAGQESTWGHQTCSTGGYWRKRLVCIDRPGELLDEIPHGLILRLIRRKIQDELFVTLIARALKAGVIVEGRYEKTVKGCPQGSPMSPILSNIVLNELDQELERRGHRYGRWLTILSFWWNPKGQGPEWWKASPGIWKEGLGYQSTKRKVRWLLSNTWGFWVFRFWEANFEWSNGAREKFKGKVRDLTKRNNPLSMRQVILALNEYLVGWWITFASRSFGSSFDIWMNGFEVDFARSNWRSGRTLSSFKDHDTGRVQAGGSQEGMG